MRPPVLVALVPLVLCLPVAGQDGPPISWQDWSPQQTGTRDRGWSAPAEGGFPALQCTGTEPFWGLDLTQGEGRLTTPADEDRLLVPGPAERVVNRGDRWIVPLSPDDRAGPDAHAVITQGRCGDGMSDREFDYDITLIGVLDRPVAGCCMAQEVALAPVVDVSPRRAAPGEILTITAGGFPADANVMIAAGPPRSDYAPLLPARTDRRGNVRAEVPMPQQAAGHSDYVFAVRAPDLGVDAVSSPVEVAQGNTGPGLSITGTLTREGVECPALRGDDGQLYSLAGASLDRLQPGDRVRVTGSPADMSFCQQGTTIAVDHVERAGG